MEQQCVDDDISKYTHTHNRLTAFGPGLPG